MSAWWIPGANCQDLPVLTSHRNAARIDSIDAKTPRFVGCNHLAPTAPCLVPPLENPTMKREWSFLAEQPTSQATTLYLLIKMHETR